MNRNVVAATAITAVTALVIGVTWYDSPARHTNQVSADRPLPTVGKAGISDDGEVTGPPELLNDVWATTDAGLIPPATGNTAVVVTDQDGIRGIDPATGDTAWSYHRDLPLCTAMVSEDQAVAVFLGQSGCAETTSVRLSDGDYNATRRSLAPSEVLPLASDRRAGVYSPRMLELWRGDLVRTVEFGDVESSAETDHQTYLHCAITDAATRGETLASIVKCPGDDESTLIVQDSDPDSAVEPEITTETPVPHGSQLTAVGDSVAGYVANGELWGIESDGSAHRLLEGVDSSPDSTPRGNRSELDLHTLWFNGSELIALTQPSLHERFRVPGAIGTGDTWGDRVLVPVPDGIAVVDWEGKTERIIPVDRKSPDDQSDQSGRVDIRVIGDTVVEWRGSEVVALRQA